MSGAFAVAGTVSRGFPPGKLLSSEVVHQILLLPPGTHDFAGAGMPLQAGTAGQTYMHLIKTTNHKKARTPTKPMLVRVLAFNNFQLFLRTDALMHYNSTHK